MNAAAFEYRPLQSFTVLICFLVHLLLDATKIFVTSRMEDQVLYVRNKCFMVSMQYVIQL